MRAQAASGLANKITSNAIPTAAAKNSARQLCPRRRAARAVCRFAGLQGVIDDEHLRGIGNDLLDKAVPISTTLMLAIRFPLPGEKPPAILRDIALHGTSDARESTIEDVPPAVWRRRGVQLRHCTHHSASPYV
jgi:hypothetical protein